MQNMSIQWSAPNHVYAPSPFQILSNHLPKSIKFMKVYLAEIVKLFKFTLKHVEHITEIVND